MDALFFSVFPYPIHVDGQVFGRHEVFLLQHEDDFLAPFVVNEFEKVPGRLAVRVFGFKHKYNQIRSRNERLGDFLMVFNNGIGSGGIHNGYFLKNINRNEDFFQERVDHDDFLCFTIHNLLNGVGHRLRCHLGDFALGLQKGIDETAFACFDLTNNHKHKRIIDAVAQFTDRFGQFCMVDADGQLMEVFYRFINARS